MNYIQINPKIVQAMDNLAVADMGMTGHYLTLDLTCKNKTTGCLSDPHPNTKRGNHHVNAHSTPVLPRPADSSKKSTSFYRNQ